MYSVVLAMALAGSAEAPDCDRLRRRARGLRRRHSRESDRRQVAEARALDGVRPRAAPV